ncbi:cobalt-zinc-cadmium efflux system protein [Capnocytophaga haemolytica]|jgi:cation diffusion facilitator family transporter|uniref:Cadmium, cobalt and zinc/H(+)-K(+) antiporter n=1 Tax=Capnocytophaga haemolytica TaxID=45243 RepID=A0AAX2GXX5_9FLAO|nr:cation diffusion facilitator family transporter [Capnocytophaga haemolytica]AMD84482.1 cation transporter [Capnocytophaga haemolytica]SFO23263.1 cobalt-zinc-cadmium efflux system protein [Capnocytophaga haemolytica]SNV10262.1 Cadmium, cobalt and zinc/H(+)-K(+) antiporter [Capnocytophaga haemolytica]
MGHLHTEAHTHSHEHTDEHNHHHSHEHGHSHSHEHHHHSVADLKQLNRAFYIGIGLNLLYTIIEFVIGFSVNSLALISDASHNLSDVASLVISLIGMKLAQKTATRLYTYGYKKASILASLINAILLVFIVVKIFIEAFERLFSPPEMAGMAIMITAFIGVIINAISAFLFYKGQQSDINIRGAFLHLMLDALVSVGVIVSGAIIYCTHWYMIDPITSFVIGIVILFSTWGLLKESMKLILDGMPESVNREHILQLLEGNELIESVHHLHIWALSSSQNALTAHIVLKDNVTLEQFMPVKAELKHLLEHEHINHCTFEIDTSGCKCNEIECH